MKNLYKTKQKSLLVEYFEKNRNKQVSIVEITDELCKNGVGKSTVYRLVAGLVAQGAVQRFRGENGKSVVYQYLGLDKCCCSHFHLKCVHCGNLIHLDCSHINGLKEHITNEHGFFIDISKTVLYGICKECKNQ